MTVGWYNKKKKKQNLNENEYSECGRTEHFKDDVSQDRMEDRNVRMCRGG